MEDKVILKEMFKDMKVQDRDGSFISIRIKVIRYQGSGESLVGQEFATQL